MADAMQGIMSLPDEGSQAPGNNTQVDPSLFSPVLQSYARSNPAQFSKDILASAAASDPELVANFIQELSKIKLSPEEIDALGQAIDMILADPENYPEIRQRMITEDGIPEDVLPEEFDPAFFNAFNIALDQISELSAPQGPQAPIQMAKGGIATLTPMAFEIAKMGRKGDTMIAHIMPHEARMLRRRGGSGTINPKTGLPEFFIGSILKGIGRAFSAVGKAIKSFAQSTVGRIVLTAAVGWMLGPVMAPWLAKAGISGAVATGVNAFAAGTIVNLAAGADLGDALKGGAIAGILTGVGSKVFDLGKSYISSKTANVAKDAVQSGDEIIAAAKTNLPQTADEVAGAKVYAVPSPEGAVQPIPPTMQEAIGGKLGSPEFYKRAGMGAPMPATSAVAPSVPVSAAPTVPSVAPPVPSSLPTTYGPPAFDVNKAIMGKGPTVTPPVAPPVSPPVSPTVAPPVTPTAATTPTGVEGMGIRLGDRAGAGFTVNPNNITSSGKPTVGEIGTSAMQTSAEQGVGSLVQPGAGGAAQPGITDLLGQGRYMDAAKRAYSYISPSEIQRQGIGDALKTVQQQFPGATPEQIINAAPGSVLNTAYQNALPGLMATYGPMALAGTVGAAALGAFNTPANPRPASFSGPTGIDLLTASPGTYGLNFGGVRTSFAPNPYVAAPRAMAMGGIASLDRYAGGGTPRHFPRKTGPINGPGTGTSDSIPAMLSDGEFVFTAKAVRAMGGGSRRAGAKKMYALMKALEKKA